MATNRFSCPLCEAKLLTPGMPRQGALMTCPDCRKEFNFSTRENSPERRPIRNREEEFLGTTRRNPAKSRREEPSQDWPEDWDGGPRRTASAPTRQRPSQDWEEELQRRHEVQRILDKGSDKRASRGFFLSLFLLAGFITVFVVLAVLFPYLLKKRMTPVSAFQPSSNPGSHNKANEVHR